MKNNNKMWMVLGTFFVVVIMVSIFIYFGINEAYIKNKGYETVWTADIALSYFGNILGALVTIAALIITIYYTNRSNNDEREYQNRKVVCDIKKEYRSQNYDDYKNSLIEFKDFFINMNIGMFIPKSAELFNKCFIEMNKTNITKEESMFWTFNYNILYEITEGILVYFNEIKKNNAEKEEFDKTYKKIEPLLRLAKMRENIKELHNDKSSMKKDMFLFKYEEKKRSLGVSEEDIDKVLEYELPEIPSTTDLYNELKEKVEAIINNNKEEYSKKFDSYWKYIEDKFTKEIKDIYDSIMIKNF